VYERQKGDNDAAPKKRELWGHSNPEKKPAKDEQAGSCGADGRGVIVCRGFSADPNASA